MPNRCRYCGRRIVRLFGSDQGLCAPCADGKRAVAQAAASESRIREELYPRRPLRRAA